MNKLVYKVGNEPISPRKIVIFDVDNNKGEIFFGIRQKDSFHVNIETLGSVPLTPENLEAICTEMKQIKDVNYPKNEKGYIVVTFTDETSVRYENNLKPTVMAMVNLQKYYEEARKAKIEEGKKKGERSLLRTLARKVAPLLATVSAASFLAGCNITITSSKDTSSDFTISIGNEGGSRTQEPKQPQETAKPTSVPNAQESEAQKVCREEGKRLWNDLMRENPKLSLYNGFFKDEAAYVEEDETLAIDYLSYIGDTPSLNMQSMSSEELTRYMSKLFAFGHDLTSIYANPNNSDSQKIAIYKYLSRIVPEDQLKIIKNAYALMEDIYYLKAGDSRSVSFDSSSESEKAKLSKPYNTEQQMLMSYIYDTISKDMIFDGAQSGVKFVTEDAFSYGMAEVPYSTYIYDDFDQKYYCKYFERNTPFMTWIPENKGGVEIFHEDDRICDTPKDIGTYEKMVQFMNSYNSGNNTDLIQEFGVSTVVEELLTREKAYAESLAWIKGSKVKGS